MTNIIVDTSVATKWYSGKDEEELDRSDKLRELIVEEKYFLVCPRIITLELVNVLRFSKRMSQEDCLDSVTSLIELCADLVAILKLGLVIDLMYGHNLAGYDAAFVALAESLDIPLFTADYKHHKKSISKNIVWLKEWKGKV